MIIYKSNSAWYKDIKHLTTSWTMTLLMRRVALAGAYTAVVYALCEYVLVQEINIGASVYTFVGVVLSILLAFRTNTAYDRWYEGRKQWDVLTNHSRDLSIQLNNIIPVDDVETKRYFAKSMSNFAIGMSEHLREGVKIDQLIYLDEDEKYDLRQSQHPLNLILNRMYGKIITLRKAGIVDGEDYLNLKLIYTTFSDVLGACERIKKTPIPFSYSTFLKVFVISYTVGLPFVLMSDFDWWSVPLVMIIFFSLGGIEMMAEEIEDPFELNCNDLPTGSIANNIKNNVHEIFGLNDRVEPTRKLEMYDKVF